MHTSTEQKNVVILGGGFGGIRCALDLAERLPKDYQIILIDQKQYHLPHMFLYEVATIHLSRLDRFRFNEVKHAATIPYAEIFKGTRVRFLHGRVRDLFLKDKTVAVSIPFTGATSEEWHLGIVKFEFAVVALGSETNYFGIAGLKEGSYGLKDLGDSMNLRNALEELFSNKQKTDNINIVVGGGGFTGVELAGEMMGYLKKLCERYDHPWSRVRVSIVEAGKNLLPGAKGWFSSAALARLRTLEVNVLLDSPIEKYGDGQVRLAGGDIMPADLLVWTAGVRANPLMEHLSGASINKTCLVVNEHLQLTDHPEVFGIGDNVYCFDPAKQTPVPATARRAIDQGKIAALNIVRSIKDRDLAVYEPRQPMFIVPIGGKYAIADFHGTKIVGTPAWAFKMLVGLSYFVSILPFASGVSRWWRAMVMYSSND